MRPSLVGLTAALAASMAAVPATAQTIVRAELGAGLAHTFGAFRESYRTGFSTVGRVEFTRENSEFALRLGGSWQRSKADSANFPGGGHLDSFGGTADIVFEPRANDYAAVAPYFFAGGAMYHNRSSASSTIDVPPTTTVTSTRYGWPSATRHTCLRRRAISTCSRARPMPPAIGGHCRCCTWGWACAGRSSGASRPPMRSAIGRRQPVMQCNEKSAPVPEDRGAFTAWRSGREQKA